jgi:hypothetical protein
LSFRLRCMRVPPPDPQYVNAHHNQSGPGDSFLEHMHWAGVGVTLKKR